MEERTIEYRGDQDESTFGGRDERTGIQSSAAACAKMNCLQALIEGVRFKRLIKVWRDLELSLAADWPLKFERPGLFGGHFQERHRRLQVKQFDSHYCLHYWCD